MLSANTKKPVSVLLTGFFAGAATQIRTGDLILTKQSTAICVCAAAQWIRGANQILTPKLGTPSSVKWEKDASTDARVSAGAFSSMCVYT